MKQCKTTPERGFVATKVVVANNYKGLKGTDVTGIFEKDKLPETEAETDTATE